MGRRPRGAEPEFFRSPNAALKWPSATVLMTSIRCFHVWYVYAWCYPRVVPFTDGAVNDFSRR